MRRFTRGAAVAALATLTVCSAAAADEVRFRNGDRLTGKVVEVSGGKLKLATAAAGDVTVDLKDVETFSTDEPVEVRLNDGTLRQDRIAASEAAGTVSVGDADIELGGLRSIRPPGVKWSGALVAGGMLSRGNSNTESFNVSIEATRRSADDRLSASAGYVYSRQEDPDDGEKTTTADNWFGAGKYDYFFSQKVYGFAAFRAEHDTVAGLEMRLTPSVGVGYQWVERPDLNFSTDAGLAWVYEDYDEGDSEEHVAARLAYHFDTKINDKVAFLHNLEYLPSLEDLGDFNFIADAAVRTTLTKTMFAEVKVEWRHDATPAPDADKNDQRFLLGVGWTF